jgi:hypothetical protein
MIRRKTVFVLGAGASIPYAFPSGATLAGQVCDRLRDLNSDFAIALRANGADDKCVREFRALFRQSGRESIDAFVQSRREFLVMAKLAMAMTIGPLEIEQNLYSASDDDWMGYLFNRMVGASPADFLLNRLKVITFNFERSFERRLFLTLKASYEISDHDAAVLAQAVPVLHIHGDLGAPAWLVQGSASRDYSPLKCIDGSEDLSTWASRLKLIHEEIPQDTVDTARSWLLDAAAVCFLGFGYHELNLERLNVRNVFQRRQTEVGGTVLGFEEGELAAIERAFNNTLEPSALACRAFLRKTAFIHSG